MKNIVRTIIALMCAAAMSGCRTYAKWGMVPPNPGGAPPDNAMTEVRPERMMVWTAQLDLQVWNVGNAVSQAVALVEQQGGFVEQRSDKGERSASLRLKVPANTLKPAVASLETLGTVTCRRIEGEDVTEDYIDVEARLKNKIVLRDRLKQLLDKSAGVQDILAIEAQLNRVQADIDSMEGRVKSLKRRVEYTTITLTIERRTIPGPLGLVFKGLGWVVKKLFVLRN